MSESNISRVKSMYEAFGKGAFADIVEACAVDVDWRVNGRPGAFATFGPWPGREGVTKFFAAVDSSMNISEFAPRAFHAAGDVVFVEGREAAITAAGKPVDSEWIHVFTFEKGRLTAFRAYYDTAQYVEGV